MEWLLVVTAAWVLLSVPVALLVSGVIRLANTHGVPRERADDAVPAATPLIPPPPSPRSGAEHPARRPDPETIPGLPVARPQLPGAETPPRRRTRRSRSA